MTPRHQGANGQDNDDQDKDGLDKDGPDTPGPDTDGQPVDPDQSLPRPGEVGWSSTTWPDSAGHHRPPRVAPPTPPEWKKSGGWPPPVSRQAPAPRSSDTPPPAAGPAATPPPPMRPPISKPGPRAEGPTPTTQWNQGWQEQSQPPGSADQDQTTEFNAAGGRANEALQADEDPVALRDRLTALANRISGAAKVDNLDASFSLSHLFANTLSRRSQEDIERELMVGTAVTTPPLASVRAEWPQPWLFARTFLGAGAVFALLFVSWTVFQQITLLPGLIIVGSFAMPAAVLIFFFEVNLPRNVSIVAVLRMVFLGGTASLLFSLIGFELFDFPWLGAMVAGLVEEPAKLLAVVLVARQVQHRYILNGMLFGAAIGAGFAAFESAGYALVAALLALDNSDVIDNIVLRGVFSPFGHIVWTSITAGALWRVRDGEPLRLEHLKDQRFWRVLVLAIGLHTIWNSPIPNLLYLKFVLLGALAWLVCFSLLQEGIGQIRTLQRAEATDEN